MRRATPFSKGGDSKEIAKKKIHWQDVKLFFSRTTEPISINIYNLIQSILGWWRFNSARTTGPIFNKVGTKYPWVMIISSPEPKAQVSFSDQNLSVVRRRCRRCCQLFTFSSSSPEPLGQFQPNLAQSILGWRGFKFVQMKDLALFQGEIITK